MDEKIEAGHSFAYSFSVCSLAPFRYLEGRLGKYANCGKLFRLLGWLLRIFLWAQHFREFLLPALRRGSPAPRTLSLLMWSILTSPKPPSCWIFRGVNQLTSLRTMP
jgi:hypothetical protein